MAMQALTVYASLARIQNITDMSVAIETSGLRDFREVVRITKNAGTSAIPAVDVSGADRSGVGEVRQVGSDRFARSSL